MPSKAAVAEATKSPVRTRTRATDVGGSLTDEQRVEEIKVHMRAWHEQNRIMNDAKKLAETHKAKARSLMSEAEIFDLTAFIPEKGVTVEAEFVDGGEANVVNVEKLFAEVPRKTFFQIATATQKAVTDAVGGNILNKVLDTIKKPTVFKIGTAK